MPLILQTAILCLPEHDAVLCDGAFPLSHNSRFVVEEWDVVRQEAHRRGIHFVLYSGSVRALDCARESNIPALAKPAAIEEIYAALMSFPLSVIDRGYGESAMMTENRKTRRRKPCPRPLKTTAGNCRRKLTPSRRRRKRTPASTIFMPSTLAARVGRIEHARDAFWLRVRWLLLGAAVGVTLAAVYLQIFLSERILQFAK